MGGSQCATAQFWQSGSLADADNVLWLPLIRQRRMLGQCVMMPIGLNMESHNLVDEDCFRTLCAKSFAHLAGVTIAAPVLHSRTCCFAADLLYNRCLLRHRDIRCCCLRYCCRCVCGSNVRSRCF